MKITNDLRSMQSRLSQQFGSVFLKGQGRSSFLYIKHQGRAVEISENDGKWWLEFWEAIEDEDAGPVKELTLDSSEQAIEETAKWLRCSSK